MYTNSNNVLCISLCMGTHTCEYRCPESPKEGVRSLGASLIANCESLEIDAGNWGPLQEQCMVLTAEPSLQPHLFGTFVYVCACLCAPWCTCGDQRAVARSQQVDTTDST